MRTGSTLANWFAGFALTTAVAWSCGAAAQTSDLVDATDPGRLVSIMQDYGHRAKLTADEYGDPMIMFVADGSTFHIYFYDCTDNVDCGTVMFAGTYDVGEDVTLDTVNAWNRDELFSRSYLDEDNGLWVELPVKTEGGISQANFEAILSEWDDTIERFVAHFGL